MDVERTNHEAGNALPQDAVSRPPTPRPLHRIAPHDSWPWLPTSRHGHLERHAWCSECGQVAAVGAERALDLGGLVNLIGRLERELREHGHRVTEAQRRLIVKKLQAMGADDRFSLTRDAQIKMLTDVVGSYLHIHPQVVETYVRSC